MLQQEDELDVAFFFTLPVVLLGATIALRTGVSPSSDDANKRNSFLLVEWAFAAWRVAQRSQSDGACGKGEKEVAAKEWAIIETLGIAHKYMQMIYK